MILQRRHAFFAVVACGFIVLVIVGLIVASLGGSRHHQHRAPAAARATHGLFPRSSSTWTPVPPLTDLPTETAVQQQYDAALASGLASSSSIQLAEAAQVPGPGFSATWPALPVANTPEQWAQEFAQRLLTIDFAHQSRTGLGAWLSAEEAPELLAGVPSSIADKVLYLSLFDTAAMGSGTSPIPDLSAWQAYAQTGARWSVSDLLVQTDPEFSQIVASGWQPIDQRFAVEDVSGVLTITQGESSTSKHFAMAVYVGSAHWHQGYGSVLVNAWKES